MYDISDTFKIWRIRSCRDQPSASREHQARQKINKVMLIETITNEVTHKVMLSQHQGLAKNRFQSECPHQQSVTFSAGEKRNSQCGHESKKY